ncbi:MAG: hypothetical protein H6667_02420 [Ardenticatenaceae bacterium]|nr:hypothetical protein [Ardenticatenaceae bacterium]MCB9443365.1 hypothetical protein [Ardenticatenaceae bacterium]
MGFVLELHGLVRWFVAVAAIAAIIKFALGWLRGMPYTAVDRGIMSAYTSLVDLNLLLGLILFFGLGGGFPMPRIEHASTMIVAIIIAHLSAIWRKSEDAAKVFRNNLIVVALSFALIISAVIILRGSWFFTK